MCLRTGRTQNAHIVLWQRRERLRRSPPLQVTQVCLPICTLIFDTEGASEASVRMFQGYHHCTTVAMSTLVCDPAPSIQEPSSSMGWSPVIEPRTNSPLSTLLSQTHCMTCGSELMTCINSVLLNCRKESTCASYHAKWKRFQSFVGNFWAQSQGAPLGSVFAFCLHHVNSGLTYSSTEVYLATIMAYHPQVDSNSVFAHPLTKKFMKGLAHPSPVLKHPVPSWDLTLVLQKLSGKAFEPMTIFPLHLLS